MQEHANRGNALDYIFDGNGLNEQQVHQFAISLYKAMDFLGDNGIVHRSIQPKHILINADSENVLHAKLSSFRSAIIYWDPLVDDVINQPTRPVAQRIFSNFQGPEVFGNDNELYNPVDADVWSYGATMFFLISHVYPYDTTAKTIDKLDEEIKRNVNECKIDQNTKDWLCGLLRSNTVDRTDFDQIPQVAWFNLN